MTKFTFKNALMVGTAIVAVGAFGAQAQAADATLTGSVEWATDANQASTENDGTDASAGDNVDVDTFTLTVTNDGTNDDGSANVNTFDLGAVTDSNSGDANTGAVAITTGQAADLTVTIDSVNVADDFTVTGDNADNATITVTVEDDLIVGDDLSVTTDEASADDDVTLNVTDDLTVTGATTLTSADGAGAGTGADITLDVDGTASFTEAVTATATDAGNVLLNFSEDVTFTGGLSIEESVAASAEGIVNVTLNSTTVAQTVTGVIDGASAGEGTVTVTNTTSGGVTFMDDVGTTAGNGIHNITINNDGNDQTVTFRDDVQVDDALDIGDNSGTDTVAVIFDTQDGDTSITGAVTGGGADTSTITVQGGNNLTQVSGAWTAIDSLAINGSDTSLIQGAAITSTTVAIGSGAELEMNANVTSDAISGAGTLNVDSNSSFVGTATSTNLSVSNITVADGVTLDVDAQATGSDGTISSAVLLEDDGTDNGGGGTLQLDHGGQTITISGAVTTAFDSEGGIAIADGDASVTDITSNIGTSSAALATFTIASGAGNSEVSTSGNLYVDAISLGQADILTFDKTSGSQVVSGTIDASNDTGAGLVIGNGTTQASTVTFNGIIGGSGNIDTLTINDNATAILNADATFDGAFSADAATIQIANGATFTADSQTDADVTTWNIVVNKVGGGAQTHGQAVYGGDSFVITDDTVHFIVKEGSAPLTTGASVLDDVFAGTGGANVTGLTVTDNSFIYSFTPVVDTNNVDFTVAVANNAAQTSANSGQAATYNQLLTTLAASTNTQINQLQSALGAAGSQAQAQAVLEASASDVGASGSGAVTAGLSVAGSTSSITGTRLASLRDGGAAGIAAGNGYDGLGFWGQAFGETGEQDQRDGVSGYDVDTYGFAVGVDTENLGDDVTLGLAFAYADTDVESDGLANTKSEIDSYQVSLYGDYDIDNRTYLSGQIGYIWADNETTRNPGGISSLVANGDYDSETITVGAEVGRDYAYNSAVVTPSFSLNYTNYDADGYTETGAGGANLTVNADDLSLFEVGVGVDFTWEKKNADGTTLKPTLNLGVRHDLIGDEFEATNTFAGGGTAFKVEGFDPAQTTFDVGAGVTYYSNSNWELSAQYDYEIKSDYDSHAGFLKASYKF